MANLPVLSPMSPLAGVLVDVERCIQARLYYPTLLIALTIPEICAGLALDKSVHVRRTHYVGFVDKYTPMTDSPPLSGELCFLLRGGLVHRADLAGHDRFPTSHVIFTIPETRHGFHGFTLKSSLRPDDESATTFDLVSFCRTMIEAAHKWYGDHQNNALVVRNMKNLIRYAPSGIPGFLEGAPVVGSGE